MRLQDTPELGGPLDGGVFAGLTTQKDGTHCAVVLLPGKGYGLKWSDAKAWATEQGGELPNRSVAALLFANVKDQLIPEGHWAADEDSASFARYCSFYRGDLTIYHKGFEGSAVAVRLLSPEA